MARAYLICQLQCGGRQGTVMGRILQSHPGSLGKSSMSAMLMNLLVGCPVGTAQDGAQIGGIARPQGSMTPVRA